MAQKRNGKTSKMPKLFECAMDETAQKTRVNRRALMQFTLGGMASGFFAHKAFAQAPSLAFASSSVDKMPPINGVYDWRALPPTPLALEAESGGLPVDTGMVPAQGKAQLYYASAGEGVPVMLLHDGLANSNYMGDLARALLRARCRVIVMDMRGHGRSTMGALPLGYDLLADDVLTVMAFLHLRRVALVGWGDGAVQALDVGMRHPSSVSRIFAFAPWSTPDGLLARAGDIPAYKSFMERTRQEYRQLSSTPHRFGDLESTVQTMRSRQPNWTDADLMRITAPLWVAAADHDGIVGRVQAEHMAATVEGAGLLVLPNTSHFAFLQNPQLFTLGVESFLGGR
ncbi:alpha/beta fold hydrolase [Acetobacter oryzifermentans]|uniref:alpha/beta fold hydrolase n=1 Tax=Acetobacter oryzifermentans TaxID=1633874 RepID=UPI0039BFE6A3